MKERKKWIDYQQEQMENNIRESCEKLMYTAQEGSRLDKIWKGEFNMTEILPTKRFDENFKEVEYKPNPLNYDKGSDNALYKKHEQTYNQAQQRKVLVPLSEFVKLLRSDWESQSQLSRQAEASKRYRKIDKYTNYITQPITEKSLEGVECIVLDTGGVWKSVDFNLYLKFSKPYKTIEHAINDGVLFILKD